MAYILLHNPKCSTSRKGLALLEESGVELDVRDYTKVGQGLSVDELKDIAKKMGADGPRAFLRESNAKKAGIPEDISDAKLYEAMAEDPSIIQRPIGLNGAKAALGRPPETLLEIL